MGILRALYSRPLATLMGWAAVVLLGFISWQKLPVELLPSLEYPQITIVLKYPNASPEEIENLLVKPIESAISGVQRLVRLESHCREDTGFIHAFFDWGSSMDFAALAVREKIDLVRDKFPAEADPPIVMKYSPFAMPTMVLAVSGDLPAEVLRDYVAHTLKSQLEKVDGVAEVQVRGGEEKEIRVEVSANKLLASGKSLLSIAAGLRDANLNYPAGSLESKSNEYLLRTMGEFKKIQEIPELPFSTDTPASDDTADVLEKPPTYSPRATIEEARAIKAPSQTISQYSRLPLKNIARVVLGTKERTSFSRHNGRENISVTIQKQSGTPTTKVAALLATAIAGAQRQAPAGVRLETVYDQSSFIRAAFHSVLEAVLLGCLLTFAVLYFFLRNTKDSFAIFLSIPCCLLGTALAMYFTGVSLNMISLGGLALAVGMLVDNSIVVIENIHRHRLGGESPIEAAVKGTHEVLGAITSSTFAHIVVFLPMIYLKGVADQIFRDLAFTISFGLLFSLFSAITLTPLFILRGSRTGAIPGTKAREIQFSYSALEGFYTRLFARRRDVLRAALGTFLLGIALLALLPREMLPRIQPKQWTIQASLPVGTSVATTNAKLLPLEKHLLKNPQIAGLSMLVGSQKESDAAWAIAALRANEAELLVDIKPGSRLRPPDVMKEIVEWLKANPVPGLLLRYDLQRGLLSIGSGGSDGDQTALSITADDMDVLAQTLRQLSDQIEGMEGISQIHSSLVLGSPEARLSIARDVASAHQVSVKDIAATMKAAMEGVVPTTFKGGAYPMDIRVRLAGEDAKNFLSLGEIRIASSDGRNSIPLKKVARIVRSSGPTEILRVDKQRIATFSFVGRSHRVQKKALKALQKVPLPPGVTLAIEGERKALQPALRELFFALCLSLMLLFMILAAQFESLMQPFLILFTIPLSPLGVGLGLLLSGKTLNAVSLLGVIVMGGIVVNNGILYVTIANQLLQEGMNRTQAAIKACHLRLRPILMTSATTVLGMIPMAIGLGEGAELNSPLATVVIGGMLSSTVLVLGVLPCLFTISPLPSAKGRGTG